MVTFIYTNILIFWLNTLLLLILLVISMQIHPIIKYICLQYDKCTLISNEASLKHYKCTLMLKFSSPQCYTRSVYKYNIAIIRWVQKYTRL